MQVFYQRSVEPLFAAKAAVSIFVCKHTIAKAKHTKIGTVASVSRTMDQRKDDHANIVRRGRYPLLWPPKWAIIAPKGRLGAPVTRKNGRGRHNRPSTGRPDTSQSCACSVTCCMYGLFSGCLAPALAWTTDGGGQGQCTWHTSRLTGPVASHAARDSRKRYSTLVSA